MGRTARSRLPSLTGATAWSLHAAPLQWPGPGRAMPGCQESPAPCQHTENRAGVENVAFEGEFYRAAQPWRDCPESAGLSVFPQDPVRAAMPACISLLRSVGLSRCLPGASGHRMPIGMIATIEMESGARRTAEAGSVIGRTRLRRRLTLAPGDCRLPREASTRAARPWE